MKRILLVILCIAILIPSVSARGKKGKKGMETLSVGVTVGDLGNPFFVQIGKGAEAKAKEIDPKARVTVLSGNYDLNRQSQQIDDLISSGVHLILLNAVDFRGIAPAVKRAKKAGIIVVAVDVGAEGGVDATVTSDNVSAGVLAAEYLAEGIQGKGNIVIVNGPPVSSITDRVQGAMEVFSKYPGINILSDNQNAGGSREGGLTVMSDLLTSFNRIDAVFAINDPTGIGAALAIRQANRLDEMFVVGIDGSPDAEVEMKKADSIFEATSSQDPFAMAAKAVEVGAQIIQGNPPKDKLILVPVKLITQKNVAQYQGWTFGE